eukprot:TRINITY_DN41431_c0_g1_i1.p1 TRINITY_DN41431_c0_g1~~TRINITY_DN41431_c0_g1_i1.p1  ORF type:complete len:610 (-),score=56.68 TRINITY_DN41431_c0_g1_i1:74-1903(-)
MGCQPVKGVYKASLVERSSANAGTCIEPGCSDAVPDKLVHAWTNHDPARESKNAEIGRAVQTEAGTIDSGQSWRRAAVVACNRREARAPRERPSINRQDARAYQSRSARVPSSNRARLVDNAHILEPPLNNAHILVSDASCSPGGCERVHKGKPRKGNSSRSETHQAVSGASDACSASVAIKNDRMHALSEQPKKCERIPHRLNQSSGSQTKRAQTLVEEEQPCSDMECTYGGSRLDSSLRHVLAKGYIAVLKSSYFEACWRRERVINDRANIPASHFYTGVEVLEKWLQYGCSFLVVISYAWLSHKHPDPNSYQLQRLVYVLGELNLRLRSMGEALQQKPERLKDGVGVIIDYCSLWQPCNGEESRTTQQIEQFDLGLSQMRMLFSHADVTSVKLTETPDTMPRCYDDRGWTLLEAFLIDFKCMMFGKPCLANRFSVDDRLDLHDVDNADVAFYDDFSQELVRAPLTPDAFQLELENRNARAQTKGVRLFARDEDTSLVLSLYQSAYDDLILSEQLILSSMSIDCEQLRNVSEVLADCSRLRTVDLSNNEIHDISPIFEVLLPGCPKLEKLDLSGNLIDEDSLNRLMEEWRSKGRDASNFLCVHQRLA